MFENYPKQRIELPQQYAEIFEKQYKSNREGTSAASGLAQKMESWLHKKVAGDVSKMHSKKTLEIGAGTLNQLEYEESTHYDIVEPFKKLYSDSKYIGKINNFYENIDDIDLNNKYERITSIATFEHILNLPEVVAKSCLLLDEKGTLRTSIPNEGTFLWKLGWKLTTGIEFNLKYKLDYGTLMQYEHVNTAIEIENILNYFFEINKCKIFGISKNIGFYRFYESSRPKIEIAKDYLKNSV